MEQEYVSNFVLFDSDDYYNCDYACDCPDPGTGGDSCTCEDG